MDLSKSSQNQHMPQLRSLLPCKPRQSLSSRLYLGWRVAKIAYERRPALWRPVQRRRDARVGRTVASLWSGNLENLGVVGRTSPLSFNLGSYISNISMAQPCSQQINAKASDPGELIWTGLLGKLFSNNFMYVPGVLIFSSSGYLFASASKKRGMKGNRK